MGDKEEVKEKIFYGHCSYRWSVSPTLLIHCITLFFAKLLGTFTINIDQESLSSLGNPVALPFTHSPPLLTLVPILPRPRGTVPRSCRAVDLSLAVLGKEGIYVELRSPQHAVIGTAPASKISSPLVSLR